MPLTAQVAVNQATVHFDKLYTYLVPAHLEQAVRVGGMVLVPFGRGSAKARMGVVLALEMQPDGAQSAARLKSLYDAAPEQATLSQELLALVNYLKENTFCTYYEAVKAIIPYGAQYKAVNEGAQPRLQKQIVRHVENVYARGGAGLEEAPKREKAPKQPESREQSQPPELCKSPELHEKKEAVASAAMAKPPVASPKLTQKQQAAWDVLANGPLPQNLLEQHGVSKAVLERMCEKGLLTCMQQDKSISIYDNYTPDAAQAIALSPAQQTAFDALNQLCEAGTPAVALLHGVTSSGKTLVFLRLIQQTLAKGKQALVLVPEISLTPQMIYRMKGYFGERVAVQHSGLSNTERLLQWQQIQNGGADVVVGTRSAVFAPLANIGIVIIDEEQEHTYHSESAPRYCAHEVAKQRVAAHGALLLLASATPSVESYHAAREGRYQLVTLSERYNNMPLPTVKLVDMRTELAAGNTGAISSELQSEIEQNLRDGKQSILLLNRRGYQTVGMCTKCAEAIKCEACSVPMVYHKADSRLLCHYCGQSISPVPEVCPKCGERIKYTGFGTQRVEEEMEEKFPRARILRMDADSTGRKNAHETMLRKFAAGEYDIMLGTQMVAKGLDFERVTLVGVLGIDQLLFAQGFKAFETVFSLVTQVVGRGGRASMPGRAVIQTVDPNHPVLNLAAKQDYLSFYEQEIQFRKLGLYPPFCTVCMAGFTGDEEAAVFAAAVAFSRAVQAETKQRGGIPLRILGPAPMNVVMVNHHYRYKLTLKCRNDKAFRAMLAAVLEHYNQQDWPRKAGVFLDFYSGADL